MQKLELTWIGKGDQPAVEPRILLHDASKDYGDPAADNMLIHGDNLLALKALEQEFSGRVKCIYIDPPYNINAMNEHYEDFVEHSEWLSRMMPRLRILRNLLSSDGLLYIQIDDEEQAYLKVICDEVFGRSNYINTIAVKAKALAGASGGGEDIRMKKNYEFILVYARDYNSVSFDVPVTKINLMEYIAEHKENNIGFYYTRVITDYGSKQFIGIERTGSGDEIKVYEHKGFQFSSISQLSRQTGKSAEEIYTEYFNDVFMVTNAQTSILTRVNSFVNEKNKLISYEYIPLTGRDKGTITTKMIWNETLVVWLRDTAMKDSTGVYKLEKNGTLWNNISWGRLDLEGGINFKNGKKPESLIQTILEMSTLPGDFVLDSFLGSGTTAAVAHKMGRRWVGIELGDHCYTHSLPRLQKVVDGEQGGISKAQNWQGGGGFKFYELAPTLIVKDPHSQPIINDKYNAQMLVAAIAKLNGYNYAPARDEFWKQGKSQEGSYIFVTTEYLTTAQLDDISRDLPEYERLLICAPAFDIGLGKRYENINVRKIPQSVLDKCEYGADNYNLNIVNPPELDENEWEDGEDA